MVLSLIPDMLQTLPGQCILMLCTPWELIKTGPANAGAEKESQASEVVSADGV